jgi:hypothetical protein
MIGKAATALEGLKIKKARLTGTSERIFPRYFARLKEKRRTKRLIVCL